MVKQRTCFWGSRCMMFKDSKSVQMYRISKYAVRWQCCCLCCCSCHSCRTFTEVSLSNVDEVGLSPMQSINNHTSKWRKTSPSPQATREGFKLLLGETDWDLNLDKLNLWANLHFSSHACVWMDNVRVCPVYVCVTSNVVPPGMIVRNCLQTWACFSGKKKTNCLSNSQWKK